MNRSQRRVIAVVRNPVGGIRTFIKYTYGALDRDRYSFTVIAPKTLESAQLHEGLAGVSARIVEVEGSKALAGVVMAECRSGEVDLIHSHGLKSGVAASLAAWTQRLPHLITSHDVFLPEQFAGVKGVLMKAGLTFVLNRASLIHSVSPGADRNLVEFLPGVRNDRRRVVLNGIPPVPVDDPSEASRWRAEAAPRGESVFGFFGRFMPQKGFEFIVEAAQILERDERTRGRFRVAAVNDGSYIRELRAEVERRGLSDRFLFTGFIPQARRVMERVDAVLMPSLWEACGLVAMEALAAGTPLISTAVHGLADVTAGTPARIVPPKDAPALAEAMAAVMADPSGERARAKAYAATARTRFDVRASAAGLERIIDEILA